MGKEGHLLVPTESLPTGMVIVHGEAAQPDGVALYVRLCKRRADEPADLRETIGLGSPS
ncbi:hypothetical protein [Candidatus Methylacidithermus pantelleriae]|uniref:Uncharacterized protein n=1 Tax=Candidatus Methylacidithermus pantelleriae TaxID=2744239 RepID=A0A8J2BPC8_9BACT|nr:hypothetical protein [Candidatus Methylacidithermus pantelleriae]CAF0703888.1 hypothetical protein MPNT_60129 [Candidatus Methylacidithermus pantelleriae]